MAMTVKESQDSTLVNFEKLSDVNFVRLQTIQQLLGGISKATVYRMVKAGKLKTHKLTPRTTTFNVGEIRNFLASNGV